MIANHSFFDWSAVLKDHAGIVTATDRTNLSNELARTVERVAASIVAVHGRRGIGSSGVIGKDDLSFLT
jgi:hypothetical protein